MPTREMWVDAEVIEAVWSAPLTPQELAACFANLVQQLDGAQQKVHILFDITQTKHIPAQAPILFIRSKLASHPRLGCMAVVGKKTVAQILAQMAVRMTHRHIEFFATYEAALAYLQRC